MTTSALLPLLLGMFGLAAAYYVYRLVLAYPEGEAKVKAIADEIHLGAMTFMKRELSLLVIFGIVVGALLFFALGWKTAVSFVVGGIASALAGFFGMFSATKANVRTTTAAATPRRAGGAHGRLLRRLGHGPARRVARPDGPRVPVSPLRRQPRGAHAIHGFGVGASAVALFYRVGGGIFTKSADVGADLVGKVEAGIPEDDPRNPGVIADNVGDNVGDVAGMGSDIFESYCGAQIATIAIASTMGASDAGRARLAGRSDVPAARARLGSACSARSPASAGQDGSRPQARDGAAHRHHRRHAALHRRLVRRRLRGSTSPTGIWWSVVAGAVGGIVIGLVTEYYTGGSPVRRIAKAGETGTATVMIAGLAVGLQSVVDPGAHHRRHHPRLEPARRPLRRRHRRGRHARHGRHHDGDRRLRPGGRQRRRHRRDGRPGQETREITDSLDELGNTTAAIGKGFAIGAAALAALTIIAAYIETLTSTSRTSRCRLADPHVLMGMLIGGAIPFLVGASITMTAVGDAAFDDDQRDPPPVPRDPRACSRAPASPTPPAASTSPPGGAARR
jgi:K(+)-stimulated pyrophosphate-energized sodium pump